MKKGICFTLVLVLLMTLAGCKMSNTRYDEQYWSTYEEATAPTGSASVTNPTVSTPTSAKKKAAAKRTTAAKAKKTEAVILPDISIEQYDAAAVRYPMMIGKRSGYWIGKRGSRCSWKSLTTGAFRRRIPTP